MQPSRQVLNERFASITSRLRGDDADVLAGALETRAVAAGETVLNEGETSATLFLIAEGEADVGVRAGGVDHDLGRVGAGALLGELSFLDAEPASASVKAHGPLTLFALSRPRFDELLAKHPHVASAVLHGISSALVARVRTATDRVQALGAVPAAAPAPERARSLRDQIRQLFGIGKA